MRGKPAEAGLAAVTLAGKVDVGPLYGQNLLASDELASIPPTDQKYETGSVFDPQQREKMRIVYGQGSQNPQIALCYFAPDPLELLRSGNSFVSFHPEQGKIIPGNEVGLFVDLLVARQDQAFSFAGSIRYNGIGRAAFKFDDLSLDPRDPNLLNFNWDNYNVFDVQVNGRNIKGWTKHFDI